MSCRVRTSDLDSPDFNVPVLSRTLGCQSNRTCEGLTRTLQRREGARPLYWMRGVPWP